MKTTTQDFFKENEISETLGLVMGNSVQARSFVPSLIAGFRSAFLGGEVDEYTDLLTNTRNKALKSLIKQAEKLGANAIVGIRFATSSVLQDATEVLAFGTAVRIDD